MMPYRYFAFLDVLGYRQLIDQDVRHRTTLLKERLTKSFAALHDINETDVGCTAISDSVFMCLLNDGLGFGYFVDTLIKLQISFLQNGLLIRGGVAFDEHFENSKVTYSPALVSAYEVESRRAFFPRIMLHEAVVEKLKNEGLFDAILAQNKLVEHLGAYHVHFVRDENWTNCYTQAKNLSIEQLEVMSSDPGVFAKYWYLQEYLMHYKPSNIRARRYLPSWR